MNMYGRLDASKAAALPAPVSQQLSVKHQRKLSHARAPSYDQNLQPRFTSPHAGPVAHSRQNSGMYSHQRSGSGAVYAPYPPQAYPQFLPTPYGYASAPFAAAPPQMAEPLAKRRAQELLRSIQENALRREPVVLTIYSAPGTHFLRSDGAVQLLAALLGIAYETVVVSPDEKQVWRALRCAPKGLLNESLPAFVFEGQSFVHWSATARYLARVSGQYGVDADGDYFADAILASLDSWRKDQLLTIEAAEEWLSRGSADSLERVMGYLTDRPLYYRVLIKMLRSYQHLYRSETLWTSWIDPLIVANLVDDLLLDKLVLPSCAQKFVPVETLAQNDGEDIDNFYKVMMESHEQTIGAIVKEKLAAAAALAKTNGPDH